MSKSKLFEYVIIHHPRQTKEDRDAGTIPASLLLKDVQRVLAINPADVQILAARQIPTEYLDKLDTVEIGVRPF